MLNGRVGGAGSFADAVDARLVQSLPPQPKLSINPVKTDTASRIIGIDQR